MNLRSVTGISLIWVATVACVSATAWFAIDRAGRDLSRGDIAMLAPPADVAAVVTAAPRVTPSPTASLATGDDKSIRVPGGQVSVRCNGTTILLRGAQPDDGWRVEGHSSGPGTVRLHFRIGAGNALRATQVVAVCAKGIPMFTVQGR